MVGKRGENPRPRSTRAGLYGGAFIGKDRTVKTPAVGFTPREKPLGKDKEENVKKPTKILVAKVSKKVAKKVAKKVKKVAKKEQPIKGKLSILNKVI